ncbi:MAG TPA: hypothetical protein PK417_13420 [Hyphomonas sp.]|nr:hypothetical protein [Hyphomonas sp.]
MSLLHPPPGFPAHLAVIWPLIWVQILALRAYVRATWGKGTKYHWSVTPYGRVFLASIDWVPGQTEAPVWAKPALHENKRIAAALSGELMLPEALRNMPELFGVFPGCVRAIPACVRACLRAPSGLPLPDS